MARPAASRSLREAIRKARLEEAERLDQLRRPPRRRDRPARAAQGRARGRVRRASRAMTTASISCSCRAARRGCGSISSPMPPVDERAAPICSCATARAAGARCSAQTTSPTSPTASRATWRTRSCGASGWRRRWLEPRHAGRLSAEPAPARPGIGVVIAAFAIGLLTGAAGLFAAVLLHALPHDSQHAPLAFPDMLGDVGDRAPDHLARASRRPSARSHIHCSARRACVPRPASEADGTPTTMAGPVAVSSSCTSARGYGRAARARRHAA